MRLSFQGLACPRGLGCRFRLLIGSALLQIALSAFARYLRSCALFGRRQIHACPPGFRKSNCDRLLWRTRSVLALPNMLDLLAHKFACLRSRGLPLNLVPLRSFDRLFFLAFSPPEG
jgi:hypothetical protein